MNDMLEGWLDDSKARPGEEGRKFYGVVTGIVRPDPDPMLLSRIAVCIPSLDELDRLAWARIAAPTAGLFSGHYFIPNPGDSVLLAFEHGDLDSPCIIGSLWHNVFRPPVPLSQAQIRTLRTLVGNQIVFTEAPPSITIQTPAPPGLTPAPPVPAGPLASLTLTTVAAGGVADVCASAITLRSTLANLVVGPQGITIQAGTSILQVSEDGITISVGLNMIRIGKEGVLIQGKPVNINPAG